MNLPLRALVLTFVALTASPAAAQYRTLATPEPLPMGTPYVYQLGNPYWYQPAVYYSTPAYTYSSWYQPVAYYSTPVYTYSSPYPFGATRPVFGLYSWDYGVYYPTAVSLYPSTAVVAYPTVGLYPSTIAVTYPTPGWYPATVVAYSPASPYPAAVWTSPYASQSLLPGRVWLGW